MGTLKDEVMIGSQVWQSKNLDSIHFRNGDPIPHVITNEEWELAGGEGQPAWCYYNNDPSNAEKHGILYNSFAVNDPRGIAPQGWRVPQQADWDSLIAFLGGNKVAGIKLKMADGWMDKENGTNGNGTNEAGFHAYPSGQRNFIGQFRRINLSCMWWCALKLDDETNWFYYLDHDSDKIESGIGDLEDGFSIRLIKDAE